MSSLSLDRADCLHRPDTLTSPIYRDETTVVLIHDTLTLPIYREETSVVLIHDTLTSPIYREETSVVNHQAALEGGDEKNTFCITEGQKSGAGDVDSDELNTVSTHR